VTSQKPTETLEPDGPMKGSKFEHPAYGAIRVVRTSGHTELFQSPLKHQNYISIEISDAYVRRSHGRDWMHSKREFIRFHMSEHQWAQFISSMGDGGGTPITFSYKPKDTTMHVVPRIEEQKHPFEAHTDDIEAAARKAVDDLQVVYDQLRTLYTDKGKAGKRDLEGILKTLQTRLGNLPSNMKYVQECLVEAMDETVNAGKSEIDAYIKQQVHKAGLDAIAGQGAPKLEDHQAVKLENHSEDN